MHFILILATSAFGAALDLPSLPLQLTGGVQGLATAVFGLPSAVAANPVQLPGGGLLGGLLGLGSSSTVSQSSKATSGAISSSFSTLVSSTISSAAPSSSTSTISPVSSASSTLTYNTTSVSGCPLITITTNTILAYTSYDRPVNTSTQTYPPFTYVYSTTTINITKTEYAATVVANVSTYTLVSLIVPDAPTTVTVPTGPGFTPLLCEPTYYAKTATATITTDGPTPFYRQVTDYALPTETSTYYDGTYIYGDTTTLPDTLTITSTPTITLTSTRPNPTSTVYDACQPNNVSPKLPSGLDVIFGYYDGLNTTLAPTYALGPVDCCQLCQANSSCAASEWVTDYLGGTFPVSPYDRACLLHIKTAEAPETCDPRFNGGFGYLGSLVPGPFIYLSNGPCGQWYVQEAESYYNA